MGKRHVAIRLLGERIEKEGLGSEPRASRFGLTRGRNQLKEPVTLAHPEEVEIEPAELGGTLQVGRDVGMSDAALTEPRQNQLEGRAGLLDKAEDKVALHGWNGI